jgi:hypothetical protein
VPRLVTMLPPLDLEPGEELRFGRVLSAPNPKKGMPFALLVSDRALFVLRNKRFAVRDPWYLQRVPFDRVRLLTVGRQRSGWIWLLALLCFGVGSLLLFLLASEGITADRAKGFGYGLALVVVGAVMPFAARGRVGLHLELASGSFSWRPPLTVGGGYAARAKEYVFAAALAAEKAGVPVRLPGMEPT